MTKTSSERDGRDQEDAVWMMEFQRGNSYSFEKLLRRHRSGVFSFCLKMLGDKTAAEDALQEVFLRVVKSAPKWKKQAKVRTWIYTIARNHCIDALRKATHRKTASLDQTLAKQETEGVTLSDRIADQKEALPDRGTANVRLRAVLLEAIESLSEEQREVFVMREYSGMPFKEIASIVGVSENTVKSRMRYALEHMRNHLAKAGIAPEGKDRNRE